MRGKRKKRRVGGSKWECNEQLWRTIRKHFPSPPHNFKLFHQLIDWLELAFLLVQLLSGEDEALRGRSKLRRRQRRPRGDQM